MNDLDQPPVVVADNQPDTAEATLDQPAEKPGQALPSSLPAASSSPSTRRSPVAATPVATSAAIEVTRPASRTLTYVASSHRYGYDSSASERLRKASTSVSSAAQIRLTSLLNIEAIPSASTRSSTRRVLTPSTYASDTTARRARSARRLGSSSDGKYEPSRTRGIDSSSVPTRVSQRRSRYPFRLVSRRSGSRSPLGSPVSSLTSASMTAWTSTFIPSRRKSTSPSAIALRTVSSTAILSSATAASLRVVGCYSNDARMTWWPFRFTAWPLLHQVWGHDLT